MLTTLNNKIKYHAYNPHLLEVFIVECSRSQDHCMYIAIWE